MKRIRFVLFIISSQIIVDRMVLALLLLLCEKPSNKSWVSERVRTTRISFIEAQAVPLSQQGVFLGSRCYVGIFITLIAIKVLERM